MIGDDDDDDEIDDGNGRGGDCNDYDEKDDGEIEKCLTYTTINLKSRK